MISWPTGDASLLCIVFYGVGGIGKSSFSRRLLDHLGTEGPSPAQWSAVPEDGDRLLPVRVDLSRQAGVDFESLILALRLTVGRLNQPMPAFDRTLISSPVPGTGRV